MGTAHLSELDDFSYAFGNQDTTTVNSLSEGFKIVRKRSNLANVDLYCTTCDVSAISKYDVPNV